MQPNILHLFTDQQRFDTIAALGHPCIRTPNLDRLVKQGTAFTRAYSPCPECIPARCSMITGRYPGRTGCYSNGQPMPAEDAMPTFMDLLQQAGYRTHGVGKCHFTPDPHALKGFQTRQSQEEIPRQRERDNYAHWLMEHGWEWVLEPHGVRGEMYYIPQPSVMPPEAHPTQWVADRTLDFLEEEGTSKNPWYLYSSFVHPHPPFAPPIPWHKLYRAPDMPLPIQPDDREALLAFINHHQNRYKYRDRGLDINLIRCLRAYYFACISFIDWQIGRILQKLEEQNQLDNTLIIFCADHGEYLGDYGCFGKRGFHDVSARIPMLVRWPGSERAGTSCSRPASLVDLAPTFLETAGISHDSDSFDGISLRSLADNQSDRDYVFSQFNHSENGLYTAVDGQWKYAYSAPDNREFLFDLQNDPQEQNNLSQTSESRGILNTMRDACLQWVIDQGQNQTITNGTWREYPTRQVPSDPDEGLLFQDPRWWDGKLPM